MNRWYFHFSRASPVSPGGGSALRSRAVQVLGDRHRRLAGGIGPRGVIVAERGRLGNVALVVEREVLVVRVPGPMRRLVVAHQEERLVLGPLFEKIDGQVGDDVGHVALDRRGGPPRRRTPDCDKRPGRAGSSSDRSRSDRCPGATCRSCRCSSPPACRYLATVGCEPSKRLKTGTPFLWLYLPVRMQARLGVQMELTQKQSVQAHPVAGDPVDLRGLVDPAAVGADGIGRMVVGHDVENVRPTARRRGWRTAPPRQTPRARALPPSPKTTTSS